MDFDATGQVNVGIAARGTVQIYNFTGQILKLNAATTTLSIGTKSFHFGADITGIKPTKYFSGTKDVDPASLGAEQQITADQPGEDSDFPVGTRLEIHNQVLGTAPQLLYAVVKTAIDNGVSKFRTSVSQQDLDKARTVFAAKFTDQEKQKYSVENLTILDSGSNLQVPNLTFSQNVGDQVQKFTASGQVIFRAVAFDPDLVRNTVEQKINLTLDPSKYLVTGSAENITENFRTFDLNAGTGTIDVNFSSTVAAKIDVTAIKGQINGKTASQLKEILLSNPNINAIQVKFSPFWVQSVPWFSGRVKVQAELQK